MPDPDALIDVSDDVLLDRCLDRPPSSLRDIEYLYGSLYSLATEGEGEYDAYLTPDAAADFIGRDNSLLVVNVDVTGPTPQFDGVDVMTYTEDLIDDVAHCKYSAARGKDHSITHQSSTTGGGNLPDQLAEYCVKRLSDWPTDPLVQEVADEHEDGDLINQLAILGESEMTRDAVYEAAIGALGEAGAFGTADADDVREILSQVRQADDADDREELLTELFDEYEVDETYALITVRIKTEDGGEYRWPGDFEVLQEAMKTRRLGKFRSKNEADDSAGIGVDYVTGDDARVVGTPEDPLKFFLSLQTERFPDFDADEAWRTHPMAEDAALRILKADEFIDACLYSGFGGRNTQVYYLPYFVGEVTANKLRVLYRILAELSNTDDPEKPPLVQAYNASGDLRDELRFHTIILVQHHNERVDVLGEGTSELTVYPVELANKHRQVLHSVFFGGDDDDVPFTRTESHPLLDAETDFFDAVATGQYFYYTMADHEETGPADDPQLDALYTAVSGDPLDVSTLLEEYVTAIDEHDDQEYGFPSRLIQAQFAQLIAMAESGLLSAPRDVEQPYLDFNITQPTQLTMPHTDPNSPSDDTDDATADRGRDTVTDGGDDPEPSDDQPAESLDVGDVENLLTDDADADPASDPADEVEETSRQRRERRLKAFIENHPPIRDNDERQAAFLLGALVGHLANYQRWNGKRRTLVDRHPITGLTKSNIKGVYSNVIRKNTTYASESGYGVLFYGELTHRLMDKINTEDPREWEISVDDLRFMYASGVSYGVEQAYRDGRGDGDTEGDDAEADAEAEQAPASDAVTSE